MLKPETIINIFRNSFLFLMSYGILYFSLKYYDPLIGGKDYFSYKEMIANPFNFKIAASPFVYRQFSTCIAAIIYQSNLYYDIGITFGENLETKKIFFSAMLSNYIALLSTAALTIRILDKEIGKTLIPSMLAILILFLSFGTINYVLAGLVEGWTWFFILFSFHALKTKNTNIFGIAIILSIFQKELIPIVFSILSIYFYILSIIQNRKDNRYLIMLFYSILSILLYLFTRTQVFIAHGFENQLDPFYFINNLRNITFQKGMIVNYIASQNLILIYIATSISFCLILHKPIQQMKMHLDGMGILIVSLFLTILGLGNQIGNNLGRILLIFSQIWSIIIVTNLVATENYLKQSTLKTTS